MLKRKLQNYLSYLPMGLVALGVFYANMHKTLQTLTVEPVRAVTTLYFAGVVSPLAYYSVLSPFPGVITAVKAPYGQRVKKGQLLYVLQSAQLAESYRQSMEDLVRATNAFQNIQYQFNGNTEMYKLGLISKVAYMDNAQQKQNSELDLFEAREKLNKLLSQSGQPRVDFEHMSSDALEEFRKMMKKPLQKVNIVANQDGMLYFPSKVFNTDEEKPPRVNIGTNIREGQTMAVIGNLDGLLLEVAVGETDFHKIFMGQKASLKGSAFPDMVLEGTVTNISKQANVSQADAAPFYTIAVTVPKLTEQQRKIIEVGMSVEVQFIITNPPTINIPLAAISEKNGAYWVKKIGKGDTVSEAEVVPGLTGEDSIQIVKGLSSGDKIVVTH